ncbi:MAG: hypothetical protein F6K10_00240 [Moorea sp. SIO2B7]|nr:hypothetical protein [Moorena sp. SIO2B7]
MQNKLLLTQQQESNKVETQLGELQKQLEQVKSRLEQIRKTISQQSIKS